VSGAKKSATDVFKSKARLKKKKKRKRRKKVLRNKNASLQS